MNLKNKFIMYLRIYFLRLKVIFRGDKWYWFDDEYYRNKVIFLLGPAESDFSNLVEFHDVDLVVKINDYPFVSNFLFPNRTDILYHNCYVSNQRNRGDIKEDILIEQGVKKIIYTYNEMSLLHNFYHMLMRNKGLRFERAKTNFYKEIKNKYSARYPTTGLQAINHILQSDFKKIYISGFTFFNTAYIDGYQDEFKSAFEAKGLAESLGNHNAKDELDIFINLYNKYSSEKEIFLDNTMIKLVQGSFL